MTQKYDLTSPDGVKGYLQANGYPSCVSVESLAGGSSGFTFRAQVGDAKDREHFSQTTEVPVRC
jgi:hypothetical protein